MKTIVSHWIDIYRSLSEQFESSADLIWKQLIL